MTPALFLALRPPAAVRAALLQAMDGITGARWQSDAQLHLTLRYLGPVEPDARASLVAALAALPVPRFAVRLRGADCFARKGRAHAVFAAVAPNPALMRWQEEVARVCAVCGITPAPQPYRPHVTLARLNAASGPVDPFLARHAESDWGAFEADSMILYESHPGPEGSRYVPVETFA